MKVRKHIITGTLALPVLGLVACGPSYSSSAPSNSQNPVPAAPSTPTAPAFSYTVSCRMGHGPYDSYVGGKSWVPWVTVTNTGSAAFPLPDLAANDSPLSFAVQFFNSSGSKVAEDDGYGDMNDVVTVQPGRSYTLPNQQINGTVNDDYPGDPTCTATADGGL